MPSDRLLDPLAPNVWLYVAAGALLVLLLVWIAWSIWRSQKRKKSIDLQPVTAMQREDWERRVREIVANYSGSDEQARMLHLVLAAALREMLSERAGRDVTSWTAAELRQVPQFAHAADVIESWEEPSFAPYAKSNVELAQERALEVVRQW